MSGNQQQGNALGAGLLILSGAGLIGLLVTLFVKDVMPTGLALALITISSAVMVGSAFATAYVRDGVQNSYTQAASPVAAALQSIPEFLPEDLARARVRRIVITTIMWLAFALWIPCYLIPIGILIPPMLTNPDASVDVRGISTFLTVGSVALVAFVLLGTFLSKLTSERAHLRALHKSLPGAVVMPNKTSSSLADLAKTTAPRIRVPSGGWLFSYVAVSDISLSVWSPGGGRLTCIVEIPLLSIVKMDIAQIDVRFSPLPGIAITTPQLTRPLEICPVEHLVNYRQSAEQFVALLRSRAV